MHTNHLKFPLLDKVAIDIQSLKILQQILDENHDIKEILLNSSSEKDAIHEIKQWIKPFIDVNTHLKNYFDDPKEKELSFSDLKWSDYALVRLMDYIQHSGRVFKDLNQKGEMVINNPIRQLWLAAKFGKGGANLDFFIDMLMLFRQIKGTYHQNLPDKNTLEEWMVGNPSGLDPEIVKIRKENRNRILRLIIRKIENGELKSKRYFFATEMTDQQKFDLALSWWADKNFHIRFAVRSPLLLNEMLNFSLNAETMVLLNRAYAKGIPFFVNLYYLSLLHTFEPEGAIGSDLAIRDYVLYSKQLIDEFGEIQAWEKEDKVVQGEPNAAGWILPDGNNVHRRYPEVAIMIPDTMGRSCGGLCVSCQRMYDFQSGRLNFQFDNLLPKESWPSKLQKIMQYFEKDNQLMDILITGGDALMSSDKSLQIILNAVYTMALRKRERNLSFPKNEKKAEIKRIRLGTRLPVYLPQRITAELCQILYDFRTKALKSGIEYFVIQTHFESAMEITPESKAAIEKLSQTGWMITNQMVFTTAASRRGHAAKLRKSLNDLGIVPYYTFSVKGFRENMHNFATNSRALQELTEEKSFGKIPSAEIAKIKDLFNDPININVKMKELRMDLRMPFLATDRTVLNMPGVGKSLTFRTIGLTRLGRRILEFEHDHTRKHSPIIHKMGKIVIIESKSINEYLDQLKNMGEDINAYLSIFGYSIGETEPLPAFWKLSDFNECNTEKMNQFAQKEPES
ncbi:MAG: KamA family protein [Bacteroidetes bacterium HGW-Bacteroidetes-1]|jgi:lysine 2,3-aminomutase|nr:MAG: KamA family protein [Bacteroidetes bacterium HGW-Bacteroidetes-1]